MRRIICVLLSVCMLLCLVACGENSEPTIETTEPRTQTEGNEPTNEQIAEITEPPVPTDDLEDPSLAIFRQAMVETPQLFAAAFFGYVPRNADPFEIMQKTAPQLCKDLSFLLTIQKTNVIGTFGYLFCIVPADDSATVSVNRKLWNTETKSYEVTEVLYRCESGTPVLVMCPYENQIPDTEVIITDSNGTVTVWSPYLESNCSVSALKSENGEDLIFDFTAYDELPDLQYIQ